MNSTSAPPTFDERDQAEAGAGGVERPEHDVVALDRRLEVVDPVGDVGLRAQRARHRAVRLEAQELDVERVLARARHPDAGLLDPALLRLLASVTTPMWSNLERSNLLHADPPRGCLSGAESLPSRHTRVKELCRCASSPSEPIPTTSRSSAAARSPASPARGTTSSCATRRRATWAASSTPREEICADPARGGAAGRRRDRRRARDARPRRRRGERGRPGAEAPRRRPRAGGPARTSSSRTPRTTTWATTTRSRSSSSSAASTRPSPHLETERPRHDRGHADLLHGHDRRARLRARPSTWTSAT